MILNEQSVPQKRKKLKNDLSRLRRSNVPDWKIAEELKKIGWTLYELRSLFGSTNDFTSFAKINHYIGPLW